MGDAWCTRLKLAGDSMASAKALNSLFMIKQPYELLHMGMHASEFQRIEIAS